MGFALEQEIEVIGARIAITGEALTPSLVGARGGEGGDRRTGGGRAS